MTENFLLKLSTEISVVLQACVAVHLLSELGHDLCDEFVKVNCHQLMFNILADHIDQGTVPSDLKGFYFLHITVQFIKLSALQASCKS